MRARCKIRLRANQDSAKPNFIGSIKARFHDIIYTERSDQVVRNKKFKLIRKVKTMTLTNILTKSGAKVHIHFGKKTTTNLWGRWVEVTDMSLVLELKACKTVTDYVAVQSKHQNDWQNLTRPYVRAASATAATNPMQPAQAGAPGPCPTDDTSFDTLSGQLDKVAVQSEPAQPTVLSDKEIQSFQINAVGRLQKFFSEFKFQPAARFVNTLALSQDVSAARAYVTGYVRLINNSDANDIVEKLKSPEFESVASDLIKYPPKKQINKRLDIYFGDAGTGKTTKAIEQYPDAQVVPCNASMLPDELMRTFDFNDDNGNPVFKPSTLRLAMEAGSPIIFDEINLLSFDCLRLLQTLTDSKSSINYNGDTIAVKDGFKIIGTMNLTVNDQVYNLPEPLVDRAEIINEFKLSSKQLAAYAF